MTIDTSPLSPENATFNPRIRTLSATTTLHAEDGQEITVRLSVFHDRSERLRRAYRAVLHRRIETVDPATGARTAARVRGAELLDLFTEEGQEWDEAKLRTLYARAYETVADRAPRGGKITAFFSA